MFLKDTYRKSKLLFSLFIIFILGQAFFSYKGIETVPFFNYGMYSEPLKSKSKGYWLISKGDTLNKHLSHLNKAFIYQNLAHDISTHQTHKLNQLSCEDWLKLYLKNITGKTVETLSIKEQ